jgi:CubicO group peptidase (beta-lactamase class C family)
MKFMGRACFLFFVSFLTNSASAEDLTPAAPETVGLSTTRLSRINDWYQTRVDAGDLAGAVVAIAKDDKLAYLSAIGFQDRGKQIPIRTDSIFWIASMTKPVTSVAAMTLVEDGRLDLDAPVSQYLPELKDMQVGVEKPNPDTGVTEIVLEAPKRAMTVRDLFRHISGLIYPPQYFDSPIHRLYNKAVFRRDRTLADFVTSLGKLPLAHQPGEVWEYSWGVDVLARIVEVQSGQSFAEYLQNRIFRPLHMVDTGFYVPEEKLGRLVDPPEDPRPSLWDVTTPPKLFSGGGGLVSTAPDYLRFCQMLLNGGALDGARILTEKSVAMMTTNALPPDVRFAGHAIGPAAGSTWGLGFAIRTDPEDSSVPGAVGSYSWSGMGGTYFWVDPAQKLIAVQMIQTSDNTKRLYYDAFRHLVYGALKAPQGTLAESATIGETQLADFVGTYDFGLSNSAADKRVDSGALGMASISLSDGAVKIIGVADHSPAARAGIIPGDLVTEIDGVFVKTMTLVDVIGKARGPIGSVLRLKVLHAGSEEAKDMTIGRALKRSHSVEVRFRVEDGKLTADSVGAWPILDFEKGKPVTLTAASNGEFFVEGGDHTRIAFVRDAAGKVTGAVLNPGPWGQSGVRYDN